MNYCLLLLAIAPLLTFADFTAPSFTIDLSTAPEDRWSESVTSVITAHGWENTFGPLLAYFEDTVGHQFFVDHDEQLRKVVIDDMPTEYKQELEGMYSAIVDLGFGDNITLGEIGMLQMYYELNPFCT